LIKSLEVLGERYFPRSYTADADDSNCEKTAADTGTRYPDTSTQFLNGGLTSALSGPPILKRTPKTKTSSRKIMTTELSGLASEAGCLVAAAAR
jgi:hypothetical protein